MKLLVFIDFTAFCVGKKKNSPHLPTGLPSLQWFARLPANPKPISSPLGGSHRRPTCPCATASTNTLGRGPGAGWIDLEGFLERFLSWTTENLDSGTERAFNTPYSENRRLGLGFAR